MNFDEEINRYKTNSLKYDFKSDKNKPDDVFPMWVADMDFKCCEEILNDMHKKIDHGIFGYSKSSSSTSIPSFSFLPDFMYFKYSSWASALNPRDILFLPFAA